MKILIVVGQYLLANNSASLCHLSYINGFIDTKNDIDILTVNSSNNDSLPKGPNYYYFKTDHFYHRLYRKIKYSDDNYSAQQQNNHSVKKAKNKTFKEIIISLIKKTASLRSVYATGKIWGNRASKFKASQKYDFVLSLSWPSISHYAVGKLIKSGKIETKKWCQLWEDPWAFDLYGEINPKIKAAEEKLLNENCNILYVTPGTLENQQKFFSSNAHKMDWIPLPSYYSKDYPKTNNEELVFSYFGDYFFSVRNLEPFYESAMNSQLKTYICGNSDKPFCTKEKVKVMPRMSLDELEHYENETDVLVFVANLGGGQIPGKIYQYSATNKIILFILDGNEHEKQVLQDYFSQFNRYVFCENNETDIKKAILRIKNNDLDGITSEPVSAFSPKEIARAIITKCLMKDGD